MQIDRLDSLDFEITWDMQIIPHGQDDWKPSKMEQESNLLEVIHFDVCSPMSAEARSEYRYVLTSQMIRVDVVYLLDETQVWIIEWFK